MLTHQGKYTIEDRFPRSGGEATLHNALAHQGKYAPGDRFPRSYVEAAFYDALTHQGEYAVDDRFPRSGVEAAPYRAQAGPGDVNTLLARALGQEGTGSTDEYERPMKEYVQKGCNLPQNARQNREDADIGPSTSHTRPLARREPALRQNVCLKFFIPQEAPLLPASHSAVRFASEASLNKSPPALTSGPLQNEDPSACFSVRRIDRLGFEPVDILKEYFANYGELKVVHVTQGKVKQLPCWSAQGKIESMLVRNKARCGFVVMKSPADTRRILSDGPEHIVMGQAITVYPLHKVPLPGPETMHRCKQLRSSPRARAQLAIAISEHGEWA
jgi:hypothetical protein